MNRPDINAIKKAIVEMANSSDYNFNKSGFPLKIELLKISAFHTPVKLSFFLKTLESIQPFVNSNSSISLDP